MEQMLALIANLGFPIVVSVYLLVRIENRLEALTESIPSWLKLLPPLPNK